MDKPHLCKRIINILAIPSFALLIASVALVIVLLANQRNSLESIAPNYNVQYNLYLYQTSAPLAPTGKMKAVVTAYNPVWWQTDSTPNITASGHYVKEGIIACPVAMKFGTVVRIDNQFFVCEDRMNPRYAHKPHFDILMFSIKEAREYGRQYKEVTIYNGI